MRAEALVERLRAQPFRPFVIITADGAEFRITHPEWLAVKDRTAVVLDVDEAMHILDVGLVTRVEVEKPTKATKGDE